MPQQTYLPTGMGGVVTCPAAARPPLLRVDWTKDGEPLDLSMVMKNKTFQMSVCPNANFCLLLCPVNTTLFIDSCTLHTSQGTGSWIHLFSLSREMWDTAADYRHPWSDSRQQPVMQMLFWQSAHSTCLQSSRIFLAITTWTLRETFWHFPPPPRHFNGTFAASTGGTLILLFSTEKSHNHILFIGQGWR